MVKDRYIDYHGQPPRSGEAPFEAGTLFNQAMGEAALEDAAARPAGRSDGLAPDDPAATYYQNRVARYAQAMSGMGDEAMRGRIKQMRASGDPLQEARADELEAYLLETERDRQHSIY